MPTDHRPADVTTYDSWRIPPRRKPTQPCGTARHPTHAQISRTAHQTPKRSSRGITPNARNIVSSYAAYGSAIRVRTLFHEYKQRLTTPFSPLRAHSTYGELRVFVHEERGKMIPLKGHYDDEAWLCPSRTSPPSKRGATQSCLSDEAGYLMKVLLSWSGKQSQRVASYLKGWLGLVIPDCEPWMSSEDLVPGGKWLIDLMHQLEEAHFCIICLTPDNLRSTWLYFEAGAIAAKSPNSPVCGYLIGLNPASLTGPLSLYQAAESTEDGTWALVRSINQRLTTPHNEKLLKASFNTQWPALRAALQNALVNYDPSSVPSNEQVDADIRQYKLTKEAELILFETSKDRHATVLMASTMQGLIVQVNDKQLCERGDARSEAQWKSAVRELVRFGLLEAKGHKGEVFGLTAEGFRLADELVAKSEIANA